MKMENIIKKLQADGYVVYVGEFNYKKFNMVTGTALVDLIDGIAVETTAKYADVIAQITEGKSHIATVESKKRILTSNLKL